MERSRRGGSRGEQQFYRGVVACAGEANAVGEKLDGAVLGVGTEADLGVELATILLEDEWKSRRDRACRGGKKMRG